jgi:hypothetical protein
MAFLADLHSSQFSKKQHSIVQRLLRVLRKSTAQRLIAETVAEGYENVAQPPGAVDGSCYSGPDRPQPLFLFQPLTLVRQPTSEGSPPGNILR